MQIRTQDALDLATGGNAADLDYVVYDRACGAPYSDDEAARELLVDL